ncbi:MAG: hypothetical protein AB7F59_09885 [Bdellovibrionales bacterium]
MSVKSKRTALVLAVFVLLAVVYQNCMSTVQVINPLYTAATIENLRSLQVTERNSICQDPENYACVQNIFKHQAETSKAQETKCLKPSGVENEICIIVSVHTQDIPADTGTARDLQYEESSCFNKVLKERTNVEDKMSASGLDAAFEASFQSCRSLLDVEGTEDEEEIP